MFTRLHRASQDHCCHCCKGPPTHAEKGVLLKQAVQQLGWALNTGDNECQLFPNKLMSSLCLHSWVFGPDVS